VRFFCSLFVLCVTVSADAALAQQVTAPPPVSSGSPAAGGFRSTLTFRAGSARPAHPPVPGRGAVVFGAPYFWGWDTLEAHPRPQAPVGDDAPTGGVQLDVLPWRARVFLDGAYAGRVDDFNGYYQHLTVAAGPHRIVIVEPGYEPLVIDLQIVAGRTTTHRATLTEELRR
jgi:hypothetical protein